MPRRIAQIVICLVVTIAALAPMAELFDHWDKGVTPANDTELCVAATFAFAGLILTIALAKRHTPALAPTRCLKHGQPRQPRNPPTYTPIQTGTGPPAITLRI